MTYEIVRKTKDPNTNKTILRDHRGKVVVYMIEEEEILSVSAHSNKVVLGDKVVNRNPKFAVIIDNGTVLQLA